MKVTIIGAGNMGRGIETRAVAGGHDVEILDREAPFDPRAFIERANWRFSKTTAEWPNWKHWYAVQSQHADDPDFLRFADEIKSEGYDARFEGTKYRYLRRIDDFLYWVSRSLYSPGVNLNRRPAEDVKGQAEHEQSRLPV